jgi:reactive intermediate/imine deaminase
VKSHPVLEGQVQLDLISLAAGAPFEIEKITTDRAPVPPAGRYPQAVKAGPWIFTAGQIPTDFVETVADAAKVDGNFPFFGRSIKQQTAYILDNIGAVLEAAGSSLDHVVKAYIYLADVTQFQGLDEVWKEYFPDDPPARTVTPALTLFPGVLLEIQVIAVTADGTIKKHTVHTESAPRPAIHQPQAIRAGDLVFLSGLMATDFESAIAPAAQVDANFPFHTSAVEMETDYIFETASAILGAAGSSLANLVRWQAFLSDSKDYAVFLDTARSALGETAPWPTLAETTEHVIPTCRVMIDMTAAV